MKAKGALIRHLSNLPAITAKTGSRIRGTFADPSIDNLPFIVVSKASEFDHRSTHSGRSGLAKTRLQVAIVCNTSAEVEYLSEAIDDAMFELSRAEPENKLLGGILPVGLIEKSGSFDGVEIGIQAPNEVSDWIFHT